MEKEGGVFFSRVGMAFGLALRVFVDFLLSFFFFPLGRTPVLFLRWDFYLRVFNFAVMKIK